MKQWIRKMYESSVIRYIFFGGCTTMVNLVSFFILRKLKVELNIANIISIILAILFAYVVNSKYVFQDKCETLKDHVLQICQCQTDHYGDRGWRCMAACVSDGA